MSSVMEEVGTIRSNTSLTEKLWLMTIETDSIGSRIEPGQFIHLQVPGMEGHILRRPFSVYYTQDEGKIIAVLYQVVGFGSAHMTSLQGGCEVSIIGPIGKGWIAPENASSVLLVAGGVGGAPLYLFAEELCARGVDVDVVLGAQNAQALVVEQRYKALLGKDPMVATDDGSKGHAGFCTELVDRCIAQKRYDLIACCGPEPMMRIVSRSGLDADIPTYISLEKRMACGIGACLSCIVETREGRKRSCVDGPVFNAAEVIW